MKIEILSDSRKEKIYFISGPSLNTRFFSKLLAFNALQKISNSLPGGF
jgi:hypothetical protein